MGLKKTEIKDLVTYRQNKSREVLTEAIDVANLNHWNLTVNRLYYAVFHSCSALLLSRGFSARTHHGVIKLIMMEYVKTEILTKEEGTLITTLFNMRNTGDYDDLYDWKESQVAPLMEPVKLLLDKLEALIVKHPM